MISISVQKSLKSSEGEMLLDVAFNLESGSLVTIYGKSGAGKTSILRMIAGLMQPDTGWIESEKVDWFNAKRKINVTPQKRNIGMIFQDYALFSHMSVVENLKYACSGEHSVITEMIEMMELGDLQYRKPETLSGGQQQRVAVARALVQKPSLLLMDEPLSAIDREMRLKLQDYILKIHKAFGTTILMVSHDTSEIIRLSDQVIELDNGKIKQTGPPTQIFSSSGISGKFQFVGEVVEIAKEDVVYIISVLIGKELVKVVAEKDEISDLSPGDKVLVASKAFNPIIRKI